MFHVRTLKMFLKFPFKSLDRLQVSYWLWKEVPQHCWRHRLQNSRVFFFFSKSVKKLVKHSLRVLRARSASLTRPTGVLRACGVSVSPQSRSLFSALFRAFCLTSRAYLNTQKYGLFCSPIYWRQGKRLTTVGLKIVHGYLQKVFGEWTMWS